MALEGRAINFGRVFFYWKTDGWYDDGLNDYAGNKPLWIFDYSLLNFDHR
jgi:hypothetical protein